MIDLQTIRKQRGLSLSALAEASGASASYISRIESGKRHPSIALLYNLASALDVPVSELLSDQPPSQRSIVIRPQQVDIRDVDGLCYRPVSSFSHLPELQVLHVVVSAGRRPGQTHTHKGVEWIYVVRGTIEICLDEESVDVKEGQSCSFPASIPHRLISPGGEAEILLMVYELGANSLILQPQ